MKRKTNKKTNPKSLSPNKNNDTITQHKPSLSNCTEIIVYDTSQRYRTKLLNLVSKTLLTTFSVRLLAYCIYTYVVKYETQSLIEDIKRLNKRFASNSYTRLVNEFNLFMTNSIEINSMDDAPKCLLFGYIKQVTFADSSNMLTQIIESFSANYHFDTEFFTQIYYDAVKKSMGIGPSLQTLKKFITEEDDAFVYKNLQEKNNLRGAHSQLSDLRNIYANKMKYYYEYSSSSFYETNDKTMDSKLTLFSNKLKTLITNPDMMLCNHITSQNQVNINNFKQNVINLNHMTVKDMYASILDSTDGIISVRIQNSISKSAYVACGFLFVAFASFIYKKLYRNYRF